MDNRYFIIGTLIVSLITVGPLLFAISKLDSKISTTVTEIRNQKTWKEKPLNEQFVVVTFYTPQLKYVEKLNRLLESCTQVNITCIPTMFNLTEKQGPIKHALLAIKPRFIYDQIKKHHIGVMFVDADMVFYRFPDMITSAKNRDKDMCLIDWYPDSWGLTTSSGVMFFNNTEKSLQTLLTWNRALLYSTNKYAPDDQVFDAFYSHYDYDKTVSIYRLPFEYLYLDYWAYSHTENRVLYHPDPSSRWPLVKPKLPPMWWLSESSGVYFEDKGFMLATSCEYFETIGGKVMGLNQLKTGESVVSTCQHLSLYLSFWEPVLMHSLETDMNTKEINLMIPTPQLLGCSTSIFSVIAFEGTDEDTLTPSQCAIKCEDSLYFQISGEGYCRCPSKEQQQQQQGGNYTTCPQCEKNVQQFCASSSVALTYKNGLTSTVVTDLQNILSLSHPASDTYKFEVLSPLPKLKFSKFIPSVYSLESKNKSESISSGDGSYHYIKFPDLVNLYGIS